LEPQGRPVRRAIREGYAHGRAAHWLHNEDIEKLFAEPLEAARARLNIAPPLLYRRAQDAILSARSLEPVASAV
jgi:ubiquinone biosynthesis protein COQ4